MKSRGPLHSRFATNFCGALLFAALLVFALAACEKSAPPTKPLPLIVGTEPAESLATVNFGSSAPEYIANVRADDETDLSFKVGGILEQIGPEPHRDWDEGSEVKAGALLARLQQGEFTNALSAAQAAEKLALGNNKRLEKLLADNVVSKQEMDKAAADTQTAKRNCSRPKRTYATPNCARREMASCSPVM